MSLNIQSFIFTAVIFAGVVSQGETDGRWSRQLSSQSVGDWVPLQPSSPSKRQVSSRVLNQPAPFQSSFFPAESSPSDYVQQGSRQLYLQSVPAGQQSFSSQQNGINQPFVQLTLTDPQYNPLAQAFVPQGGLQYNVQQFPQIQQPALSSQIVQNPVNLNNQFYSQTKNAFATQQQKPFKQDAPRYVDGYKLENSTSDYFQNGGKKKPTTINYKVKPTQNSIQKMTERSSAASSIPTTSTVTTVEKEEVQLLYVPLETLQNEKFDAKQLLQSSQRHESIRDSIGSPGQINNQLYASTTPDYSQRQQTQLHNIHQELIQQAFNTQNLQGKLKQNQFDRQPKYQSSSTVVFPFTQTLYPTPVITTPRSKKLKAHQPPLAVYMEQRSQEKTKLNDVLTVLKEARSISVLDNIGPNSPKVFVGPSNLRTPENYAKFELPYLSNVDGSRIQRNIDNLPFFVAPLSYKAPDGFAKIPFPAPHVGSVIVNPFMSDFQSIRPTPQTDIRSSTFGFSTFQQNPSTESFRTTINDISSQKPNTFNYFPSVTPNPVHSSQSTLSSYQSSFLPYDQQSFNTFRPLPANRRPENNIETSRPTLTSYFTLPPSKPTVSYFSYASPEYTNAPTTTPKSQTPSNYQYRGHYITNAAPDTSSNGLRFTSEKIQTTSIPTTTTTTTTSTVATTQQNYRPHNAFAINHVFQPANTQDTNEINKSKTKEYNSDIVNGVSLSTDTYFDSKTPSTESIRFSPVDDFSPLPYFGQSTTRRPNEYESSSIINDPTPTYNQRIKESYSPVLNQYPLPSGEDQIDEQYIQYQTENPTTNEITTPTTTTTTTTTTPAPTTKTTITRRPIHSRGRPRYTTQKPENGEQVTRSTTTRRTPTRRPSTFRSRHENFRSTTTSTTTTESPVTENTNYEPSKKDNFKTTRYPSYRNKQSEVESKPTTESSLPKTSAAARNQRLRSRGKTHFKPSDNYEGSDYVAKKKKTSNGDNGDSLAYQRDVLHQNYPVTLADKLTTHEVHTSTALPGGQSLDLTNGKIKIYETTGSTQRPYENKQFETVSEAYDNQPIFQGEQQKFLTPPDSYVEINSENGVSTLASEINAKDVTTDRAYSVKYEEKRVSNNREVPVEEIFENKPESDTVKVETYEIPEEAHTESIVTEAPVARFRSKLKSRPKLLKESSVFAEPEENTEPNLTFTRRSSANLQPVTYRPAFDRRKTTMKIEDIEAELKSNRHQLQSDSRSTTFKYPVYIPESSSARPVNEAPLTENEVTTRRNNFVRRRPARPTQSSVSVTSPRSRTTTEQTVVNDNNQNKRVRVRGRLRTRPTTTTTTEQPNDSQSSEEYANDKYRKTSERTPQKYSTRVRQPTQKYFRRPQADKNSQETDDQASYDSINRPEYIEFTSKRNRDEQYNPESGKAESHWSPKLTYNSFQPIFNPNLIADEMKSEGSEYGTKLPYQEENTEKSEIITIGNAYDDILISVTPSSNKLNDEKTSTTSSGFLASLFEDDKSDKTSGGASAFESVLEEVMRNLEQQDEDEYNDDYNKNVMKNEGGEFGEIPPESTSLPRKLEENEDESLAMNKEIKKLNEKPFANSGTEQPAEDRVFSTTVENKDFTNGRQARRRGVWRRVKVRPANKDVFQAAESQFYGNSANDLVNKPEKSSETFSKSNENVKSSEKIREPDVQFTTVDYEPEMKTEFPDKLESLEFGTKLPEYNSYNNEAVTLQSNNRFSENAEIGEDNFTTIDINENFDEITTEGDEYTTTVKSIDESNNSTQKSVVVEVSKESVIQTTPEIPQEIPTEIITEKEEDVTTEADATTSIYNSNESDLGIKSQDGFANEKVNGEADNVESTTTPTIFWDPKNIISTSMSTEISHETEICYRGKCIKTKKQDSKKATIP